MMEGRWWDWLRGLYLAASGALILYALVHLHWPSTAKTFAFAGLFFGIALFTGRRR